jgi:hypothetical protein
MTHLKYIIIFFAVFAGCLAVSKAADASTALQLLPREVSLKEGEDFSLTVKAIPAAGKNYTVRLSLKYPAAQMDLKSFNFADRWLALEKSGFVKTNEQAGELVRTAGYPAGFDSAVTVGTVTFTARSAGVAEIKIAADSLVLDEKGANIASAGQPVKITVASNTMSPQKQPQIKTTPAAKVGALVAAIAKSMPALFNLSTGLINKNTRASLLAPLPIGVELLIIVLIGYIIYIRRSEKIYDKTINKIKLQKPDGRIH